MCVNATHKVFELWSRGQRSPYAVTIKNIYSPVRSTLDSPSVSRQKGH